MTYVDETHFDKTHCDETHFDEKQRWPLKNFDDL